jgi:transcriptional regulator with XRE-family HTH domain
MNAGSRIKNLRKNKNLSQTELAKLMGLTSSAMSAIEIGKNNPTAEILIKLSDFFNVSTDYILKGIETERTISESEQEILEVLRADKTMRNAIMEVAKVKKKAISYLGNYAIANQNAAIG